MDTEKEYRHCIDPDDMTPEDRWDEILNLLAKASVRLAEREKNIPPEERIPDMPLFTALTLINAGRIPFGQKKYHGRRTKNQSEIQCIARISELAFGGNSLSEIADKLNQEDQNSRYAGRWSKVSVWRILKKAKAKHKCSPA